MRLTYIPKAGVDCPGDGWPAANHEELDPRLAARKIASGFYRQENTKERREGERALKESKALANRKYQEAVSEEVASADQAVSEAQKAAITTRKRLGREE